MAYISETKSGWRAQVERRGKRVSRSFVSREAAAQWAKSEEDKILLRSAKGSVRGGARVVARIPSRVLRAVEAAPFDLDEILEASVEWHGKSGIYFLICDDEVKYVGQSIDLFRRLARHVDNEYRFDRYSVLFADPDKLDELEELYISAFVPEWNIGIGRSAERPAGKSKKLTARVAEVV